MPIIAVLALMSSVLAGCTSELAPTAAAAVANDQLPSWNDTSSKKAVIAFVQRVTRDGSADLVPAPQRIAVFDNDGTLWPEAPVPFQAALAGDACGGPFSSMDRGRHEKRLGAHLQEMTSARNIKESTPVAAEEARAVQC